LSYFPNREQLLANFAQRTPLGPTLTPDDGWRRVSALPAGSPMITGQTPVDGGFRISGQP
jgi:enoyl-[acyl-carrier protein] reductase III